MNCEHCGKENRTGFGNSPDLDKKTSDDVDSPKVPNVDLNIASLQMDIGTTQKLLSELDEDGIGELERKLSPVLTVRSDQAEAGGEKLSDRNDQNGEFTPISPLNESIFDARKAVLQVQQRIRQIHRYVKDIHRRIDLP